MSDTNGANVGRPSPPPILLDTVLLLGLRGVYFLLARRYLLAHLSPALRDLSKPETLLPVPATTSGSGGRDRANSRVSIASVASGRSALNTRGARSSSNASAFPLGGDRTTLNVGGNAVAGPSSHSVVVPEDEEMLLPLPETDAEMDDTGDDSSYPPSPGSRMLPDSGPSSPHVHVVPLTPPRSPTPGSSRPIEMSLLGAKLREASTRPKQILELAHPRTASTGVVRRAKRTARGLTRVSRILFAVCFAESMNLLSLVIFHALGVLHSRARAVNFSVSLHVLMALILIVVPLVQCLLFTYRSSRDNATPSTVVSRGSSLPLISRVLISLVPFSLYIFLFTRIPPYITAVASSAAASTAAAAADDADTSTIGGTFEHWESGPEGWERGGWLAPSLGRVVVTGVLIMASLSGIGAVRTAWDYLEGAAGSGQRQVTDNDVLQAERSLYRIRHDLVAKRDELNRVTAGASGDGSGSLTPSGGWMTRVFGSKADQEASALRAELQGLKQMESDVVRSTAAIKLRRRRQGFRNTARGTMYVILGYVFAAYCVARLVMCLMSIFVAPLSTSAMPHTHDDKAQGKGNVNGDWISFVLALGLAHLHLPFEFTHDIATTARGISLLFTGALILSSLTMVLRWLTRVLRLTSKTVGAGFLLLTLGQLFATYVISLLVQLRTSLPPSPNEAAGAAATAAIDALLAANATLANATESVSVETASEVATQLAAAAAAATAGDAEDSLLRSLPDFHVFGRLFDAVFLLAALSTAVVRYIAMKVARDDSDMYVALGQ